MLEPVASARATPQAPPVAAYSVRRPPHLAHLAPAAASVQLVDSVRPSHLVLRRRAAEEVFSAHRPLRQQAAQDSAVAASAPTLPATPPEQVGSEVARCLAVLSLLRLASAALLPQHQVLAAAQLGSLTTLQQRRALALVPRTTQVLELWATHQALLKRPSPPTPRRKPTTLPRATHSRASCSWNPTRSGQLKN